ncbi:carbohydrate-binding family 9-like protein [Rhodohalobacter sulfatireducens]|uniref:Carbohydrate-binding family 9-like protein n=1 Tax=Rhodohalobacter sulfatireducens TaxID=2911366 RepID=A0ABS9KFH2_9BACT|nr:carbohydrate-binding family 9-like protein [Rhodohalobacter sulfatireducens]MCG2589587.1 carbohydrate-binding family 9-like protein [Rhodohalobacter sulfatireducens]
MTEKISLVTLLVSAFLFLSMSEEKLFAIQKTKVPYQFSPKTYITHKISDSLIIDGKLDEPAWQQSRWTDSFLDIRGEHLPIPRFETRAKILWDDQFLYIAAEMVEPHLWATIEERDAVIFQENNFEIFIDPDGDTHNYYELEINALKTFWDLMLTQPYRTGGRPLNAWDIKGLEIGVDLRGTLNNPSDVDDGWTLEVAIPFYVLNQTIGRGQPEDGSQWKLNFSRVEWKTDVENGAYIKQTNPETGRPFPEDNWVWSPQGVIDMHLPERWGIIQFSTEAPGSDVSFSHSDDLKYEWVLRQLYYRQGNYLRENGRFSNDLNKLEAQTLFNDHDIQPEVQIKVLGDSYLMSLTTEELDHTFYIREDSRAWKEVKSVGGLRNGD